MGMTVNSHYCCDQLESVSIFKVPDTCCEAPHSCCRDESLQIHLEDDFSISSFIIDFEQIAVILPEMSELLQTDITYNNDYEEFIHSPIIKPIKTVFSSLQFFLL
jgi:hypothetical protein